MKPIIHWINRGLVLLGLGFLLAGFWPLRATQEKLRIDLPLREPVSALVTFRQVKSLPIKRAAEFSITLDLTDRSISEGKTNPVMVYRLMLDDAQISPTGVVQIPLAANRHQDVVWVVNLPHSGEYRGTWWVYLEQVASEGGQVEQQALAAKKITVEGFRILGMSSGQTRMLGFAGIVIGLLLETGFALTSGRRKTQA